MSMKVISLNTWGGRSGKDKQLEFINKHGDTDIFCLQEIWSAPYENLEGRPVGGRPVDHSEIMVHGLQEISASLSEHVPFFRPHHLDNYGLLMLINKNLKIIEEGEVYVYKHKGYIPEGDIGNHARNIQYAFLETGEKRFAIVNFHGLWNGKGKGDSEDRLKQSDNIIDFLKGLPYPYILCGDFNLRPDTESLQKFEKFGLRNLIKEYGVTSTRTSLYTKTERFADYAFVSKGTEIKYFKVLPDEVSDHSPLYVEFEIK
jgi:endonuclease/exonuclease/phosphatase (EEP) superfamily protein YafD